MSARTSPQVVSGISLAPCGAEHILVLAIITGKGIFLGIRGFFWVPQNFCFSPNTPRAD